MYGDKNLFVLQTRDLLKTFKIKPSVFVSYMTSVEVNSFVREPIKLLSSSYETVIYYLLRGGGGGGGGLM